MREDTDMPVMREPRIYAGSVISLIGNNKGQEEVMDYHVAQGCVQSGTHRWLEDTSPLGNAIISEIERARISREEEIAKDAAHAEAMKNAGAKSVDALLEQAARPLTLASVADADGIFHDYLARPFPQVIEVDTTLINPDDGAAKTGIYQQDEKTLVIRLANASALYQVFSTNDAFTYAEKIEEEVPEVVIEDNWRESSHLVNIRLAKKLRGTSDSMTKVDAEAILEEWTRTDDPVPQQQPDAVKVNENGRTLDGNHDGNQEGGDPEAKAKENERKIIEGDDFD